MPDYKGVLITENSVVAGKSKAPETIDRTI